MEKIKNMSNSLFFIQNIWSVQKKAVPLHPLCPDGGIGRRAGLKHQ